MYFRIHCVLLMLCFTVPATADTIYVSPHGSDEHSGSIDQPLATVHRAVLAARGNARRIVLRAGTHYLERSVVFQADDSGSLEQPLVIAGHEGEEVVVSGGRRLEHLTWQPVAGGVFKTLVPADLVTEEMFVNGQRQILARYPNYDPQAQYFNGFAADALSESRAAQWKDPAGGYYHAMHPHLWGDFTWRILGKRSAGQVALEGGWQNNRGAAEHRSIRFVENIFEELDAPGEWFLDPSQHVLYFYPPTNVDLKTAIIEATQLRSLFEFRGSPQEPVRFVQLKGLTLRHAARTVMDTREPLLRSDWAIYRGGAVLFDGTEDCSLENCFFDQVGGNAIFVNNYNRRVQCRSLHIARAGANGICFVGDPTAARNPLFHYEQVNNLGDLDLTPGPRSDNYPAECLVENCLIYLTGRVEKQTAGIHVDLSRNLTIRHCSIYDMPRAGINIGDGCWGGHLIEYCDVFDTVKETGDHGSFNSWGRDRFWRPSIEEVNDWVRKVPQLPTLDAGTTVVLRNNRWRCDHGWDIDLDDGSTNYHILNNLCLRGGIKNREGYGRIVENNILIGSGFHPHVWYENCGDIFRRNIVGADYAPARMPPPPWGKEMDFNLLHDRGASTRPALELQKQSGRDAHSVVTDAQFVDPASGNYQVSRNSPALALGFKNFPMDQFGVQEPKLKAIRREPRMPGSRSLPSNNGARETTVVQWLGANVRNIVGEGEMSAFGLPRVTGVLVLDVPSQSVLARAGLRKDDVILTANGIEVPDVVALLGDVPSLAAFQSVTIGISRQQREIELVIGQ